MSTVDDAERRRRRRGFDAAQTVRRGGWWGTPQHAVARALGWIARTSPDAAQQHALIAEAMALGVVVEVRPETMLTLALAPRALRRKS